MKKITFLVISLMTSASAYGNPTTNSIYIEQEGDGSEITLTQDGDANTIGEDGGGGKQFVLQGDNQIVAVTQQGNNNKITGSIENADTINYSTSMIGDDNKLEYAQGSGANAVDNSKMKLEVVGNNNTLKFNQGTTVAEDPDVQVAAVTSTNSDGVSTITPAYISPGASASNAASAVGADQTIEIKGNTNKYTSTINTDYVTNVVEVDGDSNVVKIVQDGKKGTVNAAGKGVEMTLIGDSNKISVNQKSTLHADKIEINSTSNNSILVINQCDTGPC
jgi:hypothetical protein